MEVSVSPSESAVLPRRTQAQRRQETELALLEAATRLFAKNGIDRTTVGDIGQEAGYSRGLVNHRFGSKEAFVERLASDSQAGFVEDVGNLGPGKQIETLQVVVDTYFDRIEREAVASRAFFVMWGAAFPDASPLRSIFMADDARFRDGIAAIVQAGQAKGRIAAAIDATSFAVAFVGLLRGIGAQYVVDSAAVDLQACKATASAFVHSALMVGSPAQMPPVRSPERETND
jgi:AcrR family transcriptional regulator